METKFKIGQVCRQFRMDKLKLTLEQVVNIDDQVKSKKGIKALSSFEHGRSTHIRHLFSYLKHSQSDMDKIELINDIIDIYRKGDQHE